MRKTGLKRWLMAGGILLLCAQNSRGGEWKAWEGYAQNFLDPQGRVVDRQIRDGHTDDRTTSEGQAYGLFFALVANDEPRFDRMLAWTQNNLAAGDLGANLPAWLWGKGPDGSWHTLDPHSAADADVWMAYALIEAGRLWRQPRYRELGRRLLKQIAAREVIDLPGFGQLLAPGSDGFHPQPQLWILNPSYMPLPPLLQFSKVDPQGPWKAIVAKLPSFLAESSRHGYAMDWLSYNPATGFLPSAFPGTVAQGSYDAIRVYLWVGLTNRRTENRNGTLRLLSGMADYLDAHPLPPERVDADGKSIGHDAPVGFSAALLPYLLALGRTESLNRQQAIVAAQWDAQTGLFGHSPTYYDENLALFGVGAAGHRYGFAPNGELQVNWKAQ